MTLFQVAFLRVAQDCWSFTARVLDEFVCFVSVGTCRHSGQDEEVQSYTAGQLSRMRVNIRGQFNQGPERILASLFASLLGP